MALYIKNMNHSDLKKAQRALTVRIAQMRTNITKAEAQLNRVEARLQAAAPRDMTRAEVEAALGYRVRLVQEG